VGTVKNRRSLGSSCGVGQCVWCVVTGQWSPLTLCYPVLRLYCHAVLFHRRCHIVSPSSIIGGNFTVRTAAAI